MIKNYECIAVICDKCGTENEDMDGIIHHFPRTAEGDAEEEAQNAEWWVWRGHHRCSGCGAPSCAQCNHLFGDHDMGEEPCIDEDCDCKAFKVSKEEAETIDDKTVSEH